MINRNKTIKGFSKPNLVSANFRNVDGPNVDTDPSVVAAKKTVDTLTARLAYLNSILPPLITRRDNDKALANSCKANLLIGWTCGGRTVDEHGRQTLFDNWSADETAINNTTAEIAKLNGDANTPGSIKQAQAFYDAAVKNFNDQQKINADNALRAVQDAATAAKLKAESLLTPAQLNDLKIATNKAAAYAANHKVIVYAGIGIVALGAVVLTIHFLKK